MRIGSRADATMNAAGSDSTLQALADRVTAVIERDPGERGLAQWAGVGRLLPAALSLMGGDRVVVTTGFFVLHRPADGGNCVTATDGAAPGGFAPAGVIETDGPPGAIVLARALSALGKDVTLVVDDHAADIMAAGLHHCERWDAGGGAVWRAAPPAGSIRMVTLPPGDSPQLRRVAREGFSHMVAVERPGRSRSGAYFSMREEDISRYVAATDELFLDPERRYTTIAIGDGGNELGLHAVSDDVGRHLSNGSRISCRTPADLCIYAGVSNWGAYGLCALLSAAAGRLLLPQPAKVLSLLTALVEAGAVDGISRKRVATVDGLPRELESDTVQQLRELVSAVLAGGGDGIVDDEGRFSGGHDPRGGTESPDE